MPQPPLTVYTRDEVHSIWFIDPASEEASRTFYIPHVGSLEAGGSLLFQTWAETELDRRSLLQVGFQGGYSMTRALGIDVATDFTIPLGGSEDIVWTAYSPAYQFSISFVAHPLVWRHLIPYALAGGGAALGTPVNGTILSEARDVRSMINAGFGVKWGVDHVGVRLEWRHHFYGWTPDAIDMETGVRAKQQSADASMIRVGLFYFR